MAWYPVAFLPPQYENTTGKPYSGAVLKAYAAGTTTPIPMATTYEGTTTADSFALNAAGYPVSGGAVIIPHVQQDYKMTLYPNQAAADANSGAVWTYDDIKIAQGTNDPFFQSFSGDGTNMDFTLPEDLGDDEKTVMIFADKKFGEYVTNGTFGSDTGWTKGANWVIGSGVATATTASSDLTQTAAQPIINEESYTITYTITRSAGDVTPKIGGRSGTTRNASGTYTETIIAGATQALTFTGAAFSGTVDVVSVHRTTAARREILRPDEYVLDGVDLHINEAPAAGTSNVLVFAPSLLFGAVGSLADAAATSETNAAASAAAAAVSANDADNRALAAADSAADALISENNAATSETNAATSETNAATSETNAAASETNAAASAAAALISENNADTSETNASNSASAASTSAGNAATSEMNASNSAAAAAISETNAANSAAKLQGTSTSSVLIATGTKAFTTQSGKLFNGENVRVYSAANPANFMDGLATYSGTSLSVDVTTIGGSGTLSDWVIKVNGAKGETGAAGSLSFAALPAETVVAPNDEVIINDVSEGADAPNKMLVSNFLKCFTSLSTVTLALADEMPFYDVSGAVSAKATLQAQWNTTTLLTAETAVALNDEVPLYDLSATQADKATIQSLYNVVNLLTAETAIAIGDKFPMYDVSATNTDSVTTQVLWNSQTVLTALTAPDIADTISIYDTSATAALKITLADLLKVVNTLTEDTTPDVAADFVLTYDTSASAAKKVKPSNLSPFSKGYSNATPSAWANNTMFTFAHGLGVIPKMFYAVVKCTTADVGYSIGDEVIPLVSGGAGYGYAVTADATNIYVSTSNTGIVLYHKTTPAGPVAATVARWSIKPYAFA